jgi:hypothetical protein
MRQQSLGRRVETSGKKDDIEISGEPLVLKSVIEDEHVGALGRAPSLGQTLGADEYVNARTARSDLDRLVADIFGR